MEIREYEKTLFIEYCKIWHSGKECKKSGCAIKKILDSGVASIDELVLAFEDVDGDWNSWIVFRDDNFNLLFDTIEDASRAVSVNVAKLPVYFIDMEGLKRVIKIFRPIPYSLIGGKKIRRINEN